ncbi:MAG: xylan 1,4-beta-xylosidase [Clostridia bacterium]|nr:xylan 1,4-beta-xylosidase [Clostridia bacterium]
MAKDDKRFVVTEKEGGALTSYKQVIVDKKTGVNYLFIQSGNAGGLTPLLDREGKPVITSVASFEE